MDKKMMLEMMLEAEMDSERDKNFIAEVDKRVPSDKAIKQQFDELREMHPIQIGALKNLIGDILGEMGDLRAQVHKVIYTIPQESVRECFIAMVVNHFKREAAASEVTFEAEFGNLKLIEEDDRKSA